MQKWVQSIQGREQVGDYLVMVVARSNPPGGSTGSSGRQSQRGRTRDVEKQAKMDFTGCLGDKDREEGKEDRPWEIKGKAARGSVEGGSSG